MRTSATGRDWSNTDTCGQGEGVIKWVIFCGRPLWMTPYGSKVKIISGKLPFYFVSNYSDTLKTLVGHGGALVESKPFDRRVVGSNPALAAT